MIIIQSNLFQEVTFGTKIKQRRIQGEGGARTRRAPPIKLEKLRFFGVKLWFFTRNTPRMFAPPSARCNFFKCFPLTWNPGSVPVKCSFKTGDLLKDYHNSYEIFYDRTIKRWPFNTCDCLIEVTPCEGLTIKNTPECWRYNRLSVTCGRSVVFFLLVLRFPPPIKLTDKITEILLTVALNTIHLIQSRILTQNAETSYKSL